MRKLFFVVVCLLFASLAMAQTKYETKWHCPKPTAQQKYDVGDTADHAYMIMQGTCNATASSIGETSGAYTEFQEIWKASYTNHGRFNATLNNGDIAYYSYEGTGKPANKTASNKWKVASGTGKQKDMKASGTCVGTLLDDGGSDWVCTGTIAAGK